MAKGKRKGDKPPPTPPTPKPWDVQPSPAKGDPDKQAVFAAVGSALSAWEELETRMAYIFEYLVAGVQISLPALRAYGSVLTFRGRGEMINAAADAAFFLNPDDSLRKTLTDLVNEVGRFSARRNEIAHGIVKTYFASPPVFAYVLTPHHLSSRPDGYVLGPPEYATNKIKLEPARGLLEIAHHAPSYAYSSVEIAHYQEHFERLMKEAHELSTRVWAYNRQRDS